MAEVSRDSWEGMREFTVKQEGNSVHLQSGESGRLQSGGRDIFGRWQSLASVASGKTRVSKKHSAVRLSRQQSGINLTNRLQNRSVLEVAKRGVARPRERDRSAMSFFCG